MVHHQVLIVGGPQSGHIGVCVCRIGAHAQLNALVGVHTAAAVRHRVHLIAAVSELEAVNVDLLVHQLDGDGLGISPIVSVLQGVGHLHAAGGVCVGLGKHQVAGSIRSSGYIVFCRRGPGRILHHSAVGIGSRQGHLLVVIHNQRLALGHRSAAAGKANLTGADELVAGQGILGLFQCGGGSVNGIL